MIKNYFIKLYEAHSYLIRSILDRMIMSDSILLSVIFTNLKLFLLKSKLRIKYDSTNNLFFTYNTSTKHYFSDLRRGLWLYSRGLEYREYELAQSYFIDKINLKRSDIIIDCGANYADLWLYLKKYISSENYHTFEPGVNEHKVIKINAPDGVHSNYALADKNSVEKFYVNEREADSSIIKPPRFDRIVEVKTTTLSDYIRDNKIENVKLLKLEAEGFEPEIIQGALNCIHLFEYVAVDGGNERGIDNEETLSAITNILIKHNFIMLSISFRYGRALYQRIKLD